MQVVANPIPTAENPIVRAIRKFEAQKGPGTRFTPDSSFYAAVGINAPRWWKLRSNRSQPRPSELKALATFFGVPVDELIS